MQKRARVAYDATHDERAAKVRDFIRSLKFSVPLWKLREENKERQECPKCHKRRMFYCYDCVEVVNQATHPPPLQLPLQVYVVYHPGELRGKSTSLAASTISPDMHIVEYSPASSDPAEASSAWGLPSSLEPENTLVLYPSAQSCELHELSDIEQYKNVVFVDSTWQQSKAIARDERIKRFKHVRIANETSLFWRFQNNDPTYLATIEAIYYFLRTFVIEKNRSLASRQITAGSEAPSTSSAGETPSKKDDVQQYYHGEVDDILLYYINQYIAVQQEYSKKDKHYTTRHFDGYVIEGAHWDDLVKRPHTEGERDDVNAAPLPPVDPQEKPLTTEKKSASDGSS